MSTARALHNADAVLRGCLFASRIAGIGGWLHPSQGFALSELARIGDGEGAVVELGSFMGLSTCWLAEGVRLGERGPVYAVDTFKGSVEHAAESYYDSPAVSKYGDTYPLFEANLRRVGLWEHVRPIVSDSVAAAKVWTGGPIRLLFIDADHSYEGVKADFEAWTRHLEPGGAIAIHDVGEFPGVTRFYDDLMTVGYCRELLSAGSLRVVKPWLVTARAEAPPAARTP